MYVGSAALCAKTSVEPPPLSVPNRLSRRLVIFFKRIYAKRRGEFSAAFSVASFLLRRLRPDLLLSTRSSGASRQHSNT